MTNVLRMTKKAFTLSVVVMTLVWSLALPQVVRAATKPITQPTDIVAGDFIRRDGESSVYYVNSDMKRAFLFNEKMYKTWRADFAPVKVVPKGTDLDRNWPFASKPMVGARPGSIVLKSPASDTKFVIDGTGKLLPASDSVLASLLGSTWATKVVTIPDVFLSLFERGSELTSNTPFYGQLVRFDNKVYTVTTDGKYTEVVGLPALAEKDVVAITDAQKTAREVSTATVSGSSLVATPVASGISGSTGSTGSTTTPAGTVKVSLSANTPAARLIPDATAFNTVLRFDVQNSGSSDVSLTGVKVRKYGYADKTNVSGIVLLDGQGAQHGNTISSIGADDMATVLFSADPIVVKAGETQTLTVQVHISNGGTTGDLSMSVVDVTSASTATVIGLPIVGNSFTLTEGSNSVLAGEVELLTDYVTNVNLASVAKEAMKFKVNLTNSKEDGYVDMIKLYQSGTASDTDVANITLYDKAGNAVASTSLKNRYATFDLSAKPVKISKDETFQTFTVKLDVVSGSSRTIRLEIREASDIKLRGGSTGAYVLPGVSTGLDTSFPIGNAVSLLTIAPGSVSLSESGTPRTNVAVGESAAVIGRFLIKPSGEDMELRKLGIGIVKVSSTAITGNVLVKVDGVTVYSADISAYTVSSSYSADSQLGEETMSTYQTLKADKDAVVEIVANIPSSAHSEDAYGAVIDVTEVKRVSTNDIIAAVTINTTKATAPSRYVSAATMTVTNVNIAGTNNIVKGSNDKTLAKFTLNTANSGEDMRVNSFVFNDTTGLNAATGDITNLEIWEEGASAPLELSSNVSSLSSTSSITFNLRTPLIVAKGTTNRVLYLKGDISSGAAGTVAGSVTNTHKFELTSSSDISGNGTATGGESIVSTATNPGMTITIVSGGSLLVSLSGETYTENGVVVVGDSSTQYTVFEFKANDEDIKVTNLTLSATGTLAYSDFANIRLYKGSETSPIDTKETMSGGSGVNKSVEFRNDNGLFTIPAGQRVLIRVKADIRGEGAAVLGNSLKFFINSGSDITAKGVETITSKTVNATASDLAFSKTIVPFKVTIAAGTPTDNTGSKSVGVGAILGSFKVTNPGSAAISLTTITISDSGSNSTGTVVYGLYASAQGGTSPSGVFKATSTKSSSQYVFVPATPITVNAGSSITLFVQVESNITGLVQYDSWRLYIAQMGHVQYQVTETALGYDGDVDNTSGEPLSGLPVDGTPALGVTSKANT